MMETSNLDTLLYETFKGNQSGEIDPADNRPDGICNSNTILVIDIAPFVIQHLRDCLNANEQITVTHHRNASAAEANASAGEIRADA